MSVLSTRIIAAQLGVWLAWSGTYLAIAVAVQAFPPFLLGASRFLVAGLGLFALLRWQGVPAPNRGQWLASIITGSLLLCGGNGLVCWAEQTEPSGITALIIASTPLWMIVLPLLYQRQHRPPLTAWIGVALGLAGVAVLFGAPGTVSLFGAIAILGACLSWAIGSLWSKHLPAHPSAFMAGAAQMIAGSVVMAVVGLALGEGPRMAQLGQHLTPNVAWAWIYLVVVGTWIGLCCYLWLLRQVSGAAATSYAFVNPVLAVLLGWLVGGEHLGWPVFVAMALIIPGVVLVLRR